MKTARMISVAYGACCLIVVGALLFLMAVGSQSDLGRNILLLFLVPFWSGVPLLLVSAWSLKSKRAPSRGAGLFMALASLAPSAVYLMNLLSRAPTPIEGQVPGFALSVALAFLPAIISLVLFLFVLNGGSHETR